jgi:GcrA cell cycle regulator
MDEAAPVLAAPASEPTPATPPQTRAVAIAPEKGSATVLTLGARMCKWPIGDPSSDEFTFCGRRSAEDGPYCVEHARVAYQPHQTKKKASATELARSLRRYV